MDLNLFEKQISINTACLPQQIDIVHAVVRQFSLIEKNFVFLFLLPCQKLDPFITPSEVCPMEVRFGKRAHKVQIFGWDKKCEDSNHCKLNDFGMLDKAWNSANPKTGHSQDMLRILVPSIINWVTHLSSRNIRNTKCISNRRNVCEMT